MKKINLNKIIARIEAKEFMNAGFKIMNGAFDKFNNVQVDDCKVVGDLEVGINGEHKNIVEESSWRINNHLREGEEFDYEALQKKLYIIEYVGNEYDGQHTTWHWARSEEVAREELEEDFGCGEKILNIFLVDEAINKCEILIK